MDVRLPNGVIVRGVPDGMGQRELLRRVTVAGHITPMEELEIIKTLPPETDPSEGGGTLSIGPVDTGIRTPQVVDRVLSGAGKAFTDIGRGAAQIAGADNQAEIDESRALDRPLMDTAAGLTGNIGGNIAAYAPLMTVPGANTYAGAALSGGLMGELAPVATGESRATNVLAGMAGGAAGRAVAGGLSRVLAPKTGAKATELLDEGVPLTPGQILGAGDGLVGKTIRAVEDKLTSLPVVGDAIQSSRMRGIEAFNKAALNKVVAPLGGKVDKIGHEGIEQAGALVDDAYARIWPSLTVKPDAKFTRDFDSLRTMADRLPDATRNVLVDVIDKDIKGSFTGIGVMPGNVYGQLDSNLGRLIRQYGKSPIGAEQQLAGGLREVQDTLRQLVVRANPAKAGEIRKAHQAYRKLLHVEDAATRAGAHEGVFMPSHLRAASRKLDSSLRKRKTARGKAGMQQFAESAQAVLPSKVPDSGTVGRAAVALGGGAAINPAIALTLPGGGEIYTRPAQAAMRGLLATRPQAMRATGQALTDSRLPVGVAGGGLLTPSHPIHAGE